MNEPPPNARFLDYCCPRCQGPLTSHTEAYACAACAIRYPVVLGIPDFRVFPDPYLGIEDDHRKAARIAERAAAGASFAELVRFYWSITPEEPPEMAERFTAVAIAAAERGRHLLKAQPAVNVLLGRDASQFSDMGGTPMPRGTGVPPVGLQKTERRPLTGANPTRVLDLGTRTGGLLLAAAELCPEVVGIDIALRWLIVARQRLAEAGRPVQLVCCCAEHLPFKAESFHVVLAENVLEHTQRQQPLIEEAHRVLAPGGVFFATTWNRLAAAPEPHVRLWGVGWMPRTLARRYVQWRRGVGYEHVRLLSAFRIHRIARRTAFGRCKIELPSFSAAELANVSPAQRRIVGIYHRMKDWPLVRTLLRIVGPVLHVICVRDSNAK